MQTNNLPNKKVEVNPPVPSFQFLAKKLKPFVFMVAVYGLLQLSASFFQPSCQEGVAFESHLVEEDVPFAILVRNKRLDLGFTRSHLAQLVGMSDYNIKAIEQGDAVPTKNIEFLIRNALGLSVVDLKKDLPGALASLEYPQI